MHLNLFPDITNELISIIYKPEGYRKISEKKLSLANIADITIAGKVLSDKNLAVDTVQLNKTQKKPKTFVFTRMDGVIYKYKELSKGKAFQVIYQKLMDGKSRKTLQLFEKGNTKELKTIIFDEKGTRIQNDYCIHLGKPSRPGIQEPAKFSETWIKKFDDVWWF